jgi:hypothetical protein
MRITNKPGAERRPCLVGRERPKNCRPQTGGRPCRQTWHRFGVPPSLRRHSERQRHLTDLRRAFFCAEREYEQRQDALDVRRQVAEHNNDRGEVERIGGEILANDAAWLRWVENFRARHASAPRAIVLARKMFEAGSAPRRSDSRRCA